MAERIGEILVKMGALTERQVEQILAHQARSGQKFGQIAVAWGWVEPQQVWEAWARQLCVEARWADPCELGADTEAVRRVPAGVACRYEVVPLRAWGEHLVLAVAERAVERARRELPRLLRGRLYFCTARDEQIAECLEKFYAVGAGCDLEGW